MYGSYIYISTKAKKKCIPFLVFHTFLFFINIYIYLHAQNNDVTQIFEPFVGCVWIAWLNRI